MRRFKITKQWLRIELRTRTQSEIAVSLGCSQALIGKLRAKFKLRSPRRASSTRVNLVGRKVHKLKVLAYSHTFRKVTYWLCECKCGNKKVINGKHLKTKSVKSCGCAKHEKSPKRAGYGEIPSNYIRSIIRKAAQRGIPYNLTPKQMWDCFVEQRRQCALSGADIGFPLVQARNLRSTQTASLDRKDSSVGYVPGNIQWVHKTINNMKQSLSDTDFIKWCKEVAKYC